MLRVRLRHLTQGQNVFMGSLYSSSGTQSSSASLVLLLLRKSLWAGDLI